MSRPDDLAPITLVPVEAYTGLCEHDCENPDHIGFGLCDAVSSWSDCNRAEGRIYRVDDMPIREPGETVTVYVPREDLPWFDKVWGNAAQVMP